jgi:hypothetical protein
MYSDTVAERLRRLTRNQLGLSRVGSSPASVELLIHYTYTLHIIFKGTPPHLTRTYHYETFKFQDSPLPMLIGM